MKSYLADVWYLWSEKMVFSSTIFSNNSMSSLGRSADMKAFTVIEISSGF